MTYLRRRVLDTVCNPHLPGLYSYRDTILHVTSARTYCARSLEYLCSFRYAMGVL